MEQRRLTTLDWLDPDWQTPGIEIVHRHVKAATSDLELCYNFGIVLDKRKEAITSLLSIVEALKEK